MWTNGCSPRITVENCDDESLAVSIQRFKVVTLVAQLLAISIISCKARSHWANVDAARIEHAAHGVILTFNVLGALHSLSIVVDGFLPLLAVEFIYSLFTTFLFAALGLVIELSLRLHGVAFPHKAALQASIDGRASTLTIAVFGLVLLVSMGTDALVAVVMDERSFHVAVSIQHWAFAIICTLVAGWLMVTFADLRGTEAGADQVEAELAPVGGASTGSDSSLAPSGEQAAASLAATAPEPAPTPARAAGPAATGNAPHANDEADEEYNNIYRWHCARLLTTVLWIACASFCAFCAIFSALFGDGGTDPPSGFVTFVWILHSTFIFAGGGGLTSVLYLLIHNKKLLDKLRGMAEVPPTCEGGKSGEPALL